MLYVHCGLPRTGTSSLQAVLSQHRDRLAEVDVVYPDAWRPPNSDAHYGIAELLEASPAEGGEAIEGFLGYLRSNAGRKVLISSEALSNWLPAERRESLIELLLAAQEVVQVTCLWTLRRADRWAASMYLHLIATGRPVPAPVEYFHERASGLAEVIAGLREVGEALDGGAVYSRYDDSGTHHRAILRAVGVPDPVRAEIEVGLRDGPRRNRRLSQKAAVALLHADAVSARADPKLPVERLRAVLRHGDVEFADDVACDLVETEVSNALHAEALETAREAGFRPYVEFFEGEEVEPASAVSLDPDVIGDEDLSRLVACLEQRR